MICHQATVYKAKLLKKRSYNTKYKISADREWLMYAVVRENRHPQFVPVNIALFQGGGLSCSEKGKMRLKQENRDLVEKYYTPLEQILYNARYIVTLPHVRKLLTRNATIARLYNKVVTIIYGT